MKTETETELRELDAWILEHIFGGALALTGEVNPLPHYATDPAAAFEVLKKCAEKLGELPRITVAESTWIWAPPTGGPYEDANTLELAICRFAKALFSTK